MWVWIIFCLFLKGEIQFYFIFFENLFLKTPPHLESERESERTKGNAHQIFIFSAILINCSKSWNCFVVNWSQRCHTPSSCSKNDSKSKLLLCKWWHFFFKPTYRCKATFKNMVVLRFETILKHRVDHCISHECNYDKQIVSTQQ